MQSGAPPDKFGVLYCTAWLPIEFHGFTSRIIFKGYHSLVPGLISIFTDGMGPFKSEFVLNLVGCISGLTFNCFQLPKDIALSPFLV